MVNMILQVMLLQLFEYQGRVFRDATKQSMVYDDLDKVKRPTRHKS